MIACLFIYCLLGKSKNKVTLSSSLIAGVSLGAISGILNWTLSFLFGGIQV